MPPRVVVSHPSSQWFARDIGQLDRAVNDLRRRAPDYSAATPLPLWQQVTLFVAAMSVLTAALILLEGSGLLLWALTLAPPFLMIAHLRLTAVWHAVRRTPRNP